MKRQIVLSALIFAASSLSVGAYAADADKPMAPEAPAANKVMPHSHVAEKTGVSAASTPAAAPTEGTKGRDKSKHFHPDTK
ncbi:hypothetical protein [Ralstonia solanacearum]|uniref:hypothetical protein n=1 Tax=Ralstonia solanacearum TaxID=305 RepID=UPI0005ACD803|nr:hypothetical protein [Ralstonia solanacearum]MDC6177087.1 hypothetical protein [Ralstonia solanacearum]MDC6238381.1 hypothetical protein [Ralstonia solanacearum]